MADIRPAASLTSSLLARRGDARPAMRRQPIAHLHLPMAPQDDLGWNDIGDDLEEPQYPAAASLSVITPTGGVAQAEVADERGAAVNAAAPDPLSPLAPHLEEISQRLNAAPRVAAPKPAMKRRAAPQAPKMAALAPSRKAAFTLRIDAERHLRLRLLSALVNRSSQQLLIEALDALLASHAKVEDLAGQVEDGGAARDNKSAR